MKVSLVVAFLATIFNSQCFRVNGGTSEDWPAFTKNSCQNGVSDIFLDFEEGIERIEVARTFPTVRFTNTNGLDWLYGDVRSGEYNANGYKRDFFFTNGEFFAWLGEEGEKGRIDFTGSKASYLSVLVSVATQEMNLVAFDAEGNILDSAKAEQNTWADKSGPRPPVTRLTVSDKNPDGTGGGNIAYVEVSATANFWLIDDICTDASSPCTPLEGFSFGPPSKRIDLVFLKDAQYTGTDSEFKAAVTDMINLRLFQNEPIASKKNFFNFYISDSLVGDSNPSINGFRCGPEILPAGFYGFCPFADSVGVVHSETYGDCSSGRVFGTEADVVRSFIHEVGHAAFGLYDEYDDSPQCRAIRPSLSYNTYVSEQDCRNDAIANNFDPSRCFLFTTCGSGLWKIQESTRFIMDDGVFYDNGWSISSIWRINDYFNNLVLGLPKPNGAREPASTSRSILMEFVISETALELKTSSLIISPAPQYLNQQTYDFNVDLSDTNGTSLGTFGFKDPRLLTLENDYNGPSSFADINYTLIVPYYPDISEANIFNDDGTLSLTVDLAFLAGLESPALQVDVGGPYVGSVGKYISFTASDSNVNVSSYEWDIGGDGTIDIVTTEPTVELLLATEAMDGIALLLTVRTADGVIAQDQTLLTVTGLATVLGCDDFQCTSLFFFGGNRIKFDFFGFFCLDICVVEFLVNIFQSMGMECGLCNRR